MQAPGGIKKPQVSRHQLINRKLPKREINGWRLLWQGLAGVCSEKISRKWPKRPSSTLSTLILQHGIFLTTLNDLRHPPQLLCTAQSLNHLSRAQEQASALCGSSGAPVAPYSVDVAIFAVAPFFSRMSNMRVKEPYARDMRGSKHIWHTSGAGTGTLWSYRTVVEV